MGEKQYGLGVLLQTFIECYGKLLMFSIKQ